MLSFRANGFTVSEKNGNGQTDGQTDSGHTKRNINILAAKPVKNGQTDRLIRGQ